MGLIIALGITGFLAVVFLVATIILRNELIDKNSKVKRLIDIAEDMKEHAERFLGWSNYWKSRYEDSPDAKSYISRSVKVVRNDKLMSFNDGMNSSMKDAMKSSVTKEAMYQMMDEMVESGLVHLEYEHPDNDKTKLMLRLKAYLYKPQDYEKEISKDQVD